MNKTLIIFGLLTFQVLADNNSTDTSDNQKSCDINMDENNHDTKSPFHFCNRSLTKKARSASTIIFTEETIDRLPVARNLTAITLLAPGTTQGDSAFGNLSSIHGASVAENSYIINGMEVSNFRNGLGSSSAPFEFYKEIKVTTGGFGVEFGHATGGIIEAVTKSGTNDWQFGINADYAPNRFRKSNYNVYRHDGSLFSDNIHNEQDELNMNLTISGPLIKDKLFVYALYSPRKSSSTAIIQRGYKLIESKSDDAFWGTKLDWIINDKHQLELTAFSDKQYRTNSSYFIGQPPDEIVHQFLDRNYSSTGGENYILKYSAEFSSDFSLSVLLGHNKFNRTLKVTTDDEPLVIDARYNSEGGGGLAVWNDEIPTFKNDKRNQLKIDTLFTANNQHKIHLGIDLQRNSSFDFQSYPGGVYYRYVDVLPGSMLQGGIVPDDVTELSRQRILKIGGTFDVNNLAFYFEDNWSVSDNFTLTLGLRNESFENKDDKGRIFIKVRNEWAPRFAGSWDINSDGKSKLYFNAGRYHLPIASNINIELAKSEAFTQSYYVLNGINADGTPIQGEQIGGTAYFENDLVPDANTTRDLNLKPTFQDEFILGYEKEVFDNVKAGGRYIYRELHNVIENVAIDAAVIAWAGDQLTIDGETSPEVWDGFHQYVLTNPGQNMRIFLPEFNQIVDLTAQQLGYPKATRSYKALEFYFEKYWDGEFMLQGSYTYSINKGNYEGLVNSDNGQDEAGLTSRFDQLGLTDGSYGLLPNDRPHTFKLFGAWQFQQNWNLGFNTLITSGRPINAFGIHPDDFFASLYGALSFYQNEELAPRGSRERTPFITNLDLSLSYQHDFGWKNSTGLFKIDVLNVFDAHNITEVVETADTDSGTANPNYLLARGFQQPQYLVFSANFSF